MKPMPSQTEEAVTFEAAKKNPLLRQACLDRKAKEWNNECIGRYVYDPTGRKMLADMRGKIRELKAQESDFGGSSKLLKRTARNMHNLYAGAPFIKDNVGKGQKNTMYVFRIAFDLTEREFSSIVNDHEGHHACDLSRGMDIGGRIITHKELETVGTYVVQHVSEVRAFANQLEAIGSMVLQRAGREEMVHNIISRLILNYDALIFLELREIHGMNDPLWEAMIRPKKDLVREIKGRIADDSTKEDVELFMLRMTIAGFEPLLSRLRDSNPELWRRLGFEKTLTESIQKLGQELNR